MYFTLLVSQSHLQLVLYVLFFIVAQDGLDSAINVQDPSHLRKEGGPRENRMASPAALPHLCKKKKKKKTTTVVPNSPITTASL